MFTEEQLNQLREVIKAETEPIKKQLDTVEMKVEAVNSKLDRTHKELAELSRDILLTVGEHHDKLEKRVTRLEQHADLQPLE